MPRATARRRTEVGAAVQKADGTRGARQDELAHALGVGLVTISCYAARKPAIGIRVLIDVSAYLGILATLPPNAGRTKVGESLRFKDDLAAAVRTIVAQRCRQPDLVAAVKALVATSSVDFGRSALNCGCGSASDEDNQ